MKPLVSIIVPIYNAASYLQETLDSILASTYRPIEVVMVDDGSKDNSLRIAQDYCANHFECVVVAQENRGVSAARNTAIRLAKGIYILPVDADDKIADTLKMSGRQVSVDAPFVEGEDNSLIDVMVNEDSPNADHTLINESLSREIDRALATLTPREADILRKFFCIGVPEKTLEEIGIELHLTRERVRQIKEKAIRRLKSSSRSKVLKTYLG
jgi:RNA polymerase sigma factor (sigma-70 family)